MAEHPRYRVEGDVHCIDVRLTTLDQLFDNRDPAPFRERDLDPDLVEYLVAAAEDLAAGAFKVVVWLARPSRSDEVVDGMRAHFEYEIQRIDRRRHRHQRTGQVALAIGVTLLIGLLSLAQLIGQPPLSNLRTALREGLVISSWIVLWRPVEALLFDWLPVHRERKLLTRLLAAPVEVREGALSQPKRPVM